MNLCKDILTINEVMKITGIKRSSLYLFIRDNGFPAPKKLGSRMARWSKKEVLLWMKEKGFDISEE